MCVSVRNGIDGVCLKEFSVEKRSIGAPIELIERKSKRIRPLALNFFQGELLNLM